VVVQQKQGQEEKQGRTEFYYAGGVVQPRAASCKWRKEVSLEH
ncbi:hypothetical protein A2U01_0047498, partial [Trifolium medium]